MERLGRSFEKHPILGIVLVVFILSVIVSSISDSNRSKGNVSVSSTDNHVVSICDQDPTALKSRVMAVSYKQLSKDPASFDGDIATFKGQILQIQQSGDEGVMRLSVTNLGYGVWSPNDVIYVTYRTATPAVEGDIVSVTGALTGSQTYTSQANFQITIPSMNVCVVETASKTTTATPAKKTSSAAPVQSAPQQTTTIPTAPTTPASWHTVQTITANTTENTAPFTIQGKQWSVQWSCPSLNVPTTPTVRVYSPGSAGYKDDIAEPDVCPSSNTTYLYDGPGTFYLSVGIFSPAAMIMTIQDYY